MIRALEAFLGYRVISDAVSAASPTSLSLDVAATVPDGASATLDPSFVGFGIEPTSLFSYMGYDKPNTLTDNLLANLANYTGAPPHIRIGGNTQDNMIYDENMDQWTWIWNPNATGVGVVKSDSMLIGPRFFAAASRLPAGTPVTWGLNLADAAAGYAGRLAAMAAQALDRCTPRLRLMAFEIGNEPDLYRQNGFRSDDDDGNPDRGEPSWGGRAYAAEWRARAQMLYETVLAPRGRRRASFEAAATASTIGTDFGVADLVGFGMLSPSSNTTSNDTSDTSTDNTNDTATANDDTFLSAWNQHDYYYYIGVSGYAITLSHLLTLSTTETQFAEWAAQAAQAAGTGRAYALREMGVVGPVGAAGVTDVFGAALWALNFLCYAAARAHVAGGVQLHMTDNSAASAWQPIALPGLGGPKVRPLYAGVAAFAQTLGPGCTAQLAAVEPTGMPDGYADAVRAYAVYRSGALASVVVVNGAVANASSADKGSLPVSLRLPRALAGQTLHLSYLTGPGADAARGTTWNGLSYESRGDGTPEAVAAADADQTVAVARDGTARFRVRDSEAVVANLGARLGSSSPPKNDNDDDDGAAACAAQQQQQQPGVGGPSTTTTWGGNNNNNGNNNGDDDRESGTPPPPQPPVPTKPMNHGCRLMTLSLALVVAVLVL
ncbi:glycoside hydrolase family 79 protein [Xylariomycetidae sp. FL0641]|nr:glycoside hydrolase family 79 protein [Xylariomycetidae sp. FL0641]